jgi:hypothetical protein
MQINTYTAGYNSGGMVDLVPDQPDVFCFDDEIFTGNRELTSIE